MSIGKALAIVYLPKKKIFFQELLGLTLKKILYLSTNRCFRENDRKVEE